MLISCFHPLLVLYQLKKATLAMNEDKKRKPFLKLIANTSKRPRVARISSSGEQRKVVSTSPTHNGGVALQAAGETFVPPKKGDLEKGGTLPSDPIAHSCPRKVDSHEWVCLVCTLHNSGNRKRCQACGTREPIMNGAPPVEAPHDPLPRTFYCTPAVNNSQQKDSSIVLKLVKKLDTPKEKGVNKPKTPIQRSSTTDVEKNDHKSRALASTAESGNAPSKRNGNNERSPSVRTGLKTTAPMSNDPSENTSSVSAIRNARSAPVQIPRDHETPVLLHGNYEQMQLTLVSIVGQVESLSKLICAQRDEIQSLRKQNNEIFMMQKQTLHETQEMRALLTIPPFGHDTERSHATPAAALTIEIPQTGVSQEAKHGGNTMMVTGIAWCCVSLLAALLYSNYKP